MPKKASELLKANKEILDLLSECYANSSFESYSKAAEDILKNAQKTDLRKLDFLDFDKCTQKFNGAKLSCVEYIFKFLYCYDYLIDAEAFERFFGSKIIIKDKFESKKELQKEKLSMVKDSEFNPPALDFIQLERLLAFENNSSSEDYNTVILAFCFYMLFNAGMSPTTLRKELNLKNVSDGKVVIKNKTYDIPKKYNKFISDKISTKRTKFTNLDDYIYNLGNDKDVNIEDLMPSNITEARKNCLHMCSNCGKMYLSFSTEWKSFKGRIVCTDCAQRLHDSDVKKNKIEDIISYESELLIDEKRKNKKISSKDFDEWAESRRELGKLGEEFVYNEEVKKLKLLDSEYSKYVDKTPAEDNSNGYDILSFSPDGEKIYIEVKATESSDEKSPFYLTENERATAEKYISEGKKYEIHRVFNVRKKPERVIYEPFPSDWEFEVIIYRVLKKR